MSHAQIESRIAGLADPDPPGPDDESAHRISGIAIGAGDITNGLHGKKYWGAEELQEAAASLIGTPVKALHSEQEVGEIVDAGYLPDRGLVYEADLTDSELAKGVDSGRLTVSIEASHHDGGSVETSRGKAMAATGINFTGMAIVQRGAAPSATAESGEAAALSPAEIHDALASDGDVDQDGGPDTIDGTEAALADIEEIDIGDVVSWRTGNGTLAYGKVRGSIESGSYDDVFDIDRRVTAPAVLAVRYRPGQGNTWESTETQVARNPDSVTLLENFPAAPAQEPTADASSSAERDEVPAADEAALASDYDEGETVQWDWGGGTAYGRVAERIVDEGVITRTFDGTEVTRDSDEEAVYVLDVWRGEPDDADGEGEYEGQALQYESRVSSWDAPERAQMAALAQVNGQTVDLTLPGRVRNAIEAGLEAKEEYAEELGDCGSGVGEAMAEALLEGPTPDLIMNGADVADNGGPVTYLSSHGEDAPDTPPTEWDEETWTDGCGPVQDALWGHYLEWFEDKQAELEDAMDAEMAATKLAEATGDDPDPPTTCRECGERERTFNTMRCPACHSEMSEEDHPPLATAPDEEIEAWREQQAAAAAIPYEPTNVSVEDVTADDGPGFTDDEWDGDDVIASLPNPSDSEDAVDVLDQTMAVVPADDDARDAKSNWKAPFRAGVDAPVNTRALVAIDSALSGARGGFDGLSEETESELSEWTQSMLAAAPDDLFGADDDESGEQSKTAANASPAADDGTGPEDAGRTDADADSDSHRDAAAASRETDMGDDNTNPDVTELKARLSEKTDRIDDLEAELSELRDENETLEARAAAVDEAESAFAAALAEHVPRDAEALQADLSLSQMRDWLDDIDEASVEDAAAAEADVRSGAGGQSAALSESERERKQELEAKLSELDDKEGMLAEKERERVEAELADLTGGDA